MATHSPSRYSFSPSSTHFEQLEMAALVAALDDAGPQRRVLPHALGEEAAQDAIFGLESVFSETSEPAPANGDESLPLEAPADLRLES